MTFAHQVKNEVCHNKALINHHSRSLLYGMLLFGRHFDEDSIQISTEHKAVARLCARLIFSHIPMAASVTTQEYRGNFEKRTYVVTVDDENDRRTVLDFFTQKDVNDLLHDAKTMHAFLAGATLVAGNISDPQKDYHFEIICPDEAISKELMALLEMTGIHARCMVRRDAPVVYIKDSQTIENLLTMFGAHKSVMDMMNVKIYKDMRNQVNRVTNCETSNIMKSAGASAVQLKDIRYLEEKGRLEGLPVTLRETAEARREHPDATLRELAEIMGVSRSGINHRLKKISDIAQEVRSEIVE